MKKYPKIPRAGEKNTEQLLGKSVTVVEKLDGANFRFTHSKNVDGVEEDRLVFGSRNVIYKNEKDTDKNFEHAVEYVRDKLSPEQFIEDVERDDDQLTIYGEAMHPHTLEYDWDNTPNFLVFDVYSESDGWLRWPDIKRVADRAGFETVPELVSGNTYESFENLPTEFESEYGARVPEGVVIRGHGHRAKYRTEEFLDRHAGGSSDKQTEPLSDTHELANSILAKEPWAMKMIHKYEDNGHDIEMGIMEDLWRDVFDDIMEENYEEIMLGDWQLDTKEFRSVIASHTADRLREYIHSGNRGAADL